MARVKGPLLGTSAKGSLGNSLTFQAWKGINVVKIKRDPSNPSSTDQQAERSKYGSCIQAYREYPITTLDKEAFNRKLKYYKRIETPYNAYVRDCLDCKIGGVDWRKLHNAEFETVGASTVRATIDGYYNETLYCWVGDAIHNMASIGSQYPSGPDYTYTFEWTETVFPCTRFIVFRAGGVDHSGYYKNTFEEIPPP